MTDLRRFDPQIQTEDIAFRPDEMVDCECGRANAPNRSACIYCGKRLETQALSLASLEPVESWENAFNVIVTGAQDLAALAPFIDAGKAGSKVLEGSRCAYPIARVASATEADRLVQGLVAKGLTARVISDDELSPRRPHTRLSGIEIGESAITLIDFNTRSTVEVLREDLALAVTGVLIQTRSESVQQRKRKATVVLDESDYDAREPLLDIYSRHSGTGFRVLLTGFDFSVLGDRKELVGEKNLASLLAQLQAACPNLKVADDYAALRPLLDPIWPIEIRTDLMGKRIVRFGKSGSAKASTTSNLEQFTKFSRLQWHVR
jgi:hypothetical protein